MIVAVQAAVTVGEEDAVPALMFAHGFVGVFNTRKIAETNREDTINRIF